MAEGCYNPDDHYLPASYNAIPFEALDVTSQRGRRGAEGEFPWGESTAYVDMGRSIRTYSISGRFTGNDHIILSNALKLVVEIPGPGILVHPTDGILMVACKSIRFKDNPVENAGETTFEADFVEANTLDNGIQLLTNIASLSITPILSATSNSFKSSYSPESARWYNSDAIVLTMASGITSIRDEYSRATLTNENRWEILSNFNSTIDDNYIVANAENASTVVLNGLSYIYNDAENSTLRKSAFKNLTNWASQSPTTVAESGVMENAVYSFIRATAAAYLAKSYMDTTPYSLSEALDEFDAFTTIINEEIEIAHHDCNDPFLYRELLKFRSEAQKALLDRAYKLPALVEYKFTGATHSLVAAYEIMNDAKRFKEIEDRNVGLPWNIGPNIIAPRVAS